MSKVCKPKGTDVSDLKNMSSQVPQYPQQTQQTHKQSLRPGTPETTMDFEKPEYESGGLPMITPMFDDDKPIKIESTPSW